MKSKYDWCGVCLVVNINATKSTYTEMTGRVTYKWPLFSINCDHYSETIKTSEGVIEKEYCRKGKCYRDIVYINKSKK